MTHDRVMQGFLEEQFEEGTRLAADSDLVQIQPAGGMPPDRYLVRYRCKGLVRERDGEVKEADEFLIGVAFPPDYLAEANPMRVVTWLHPFNIWHPNIMAPAACVGRILPGTPLKDVIHQVYDIITYHKWAPHDALNPDASQWARQHQELFPVDRRPLRRRRLNLTVEPAAAQGEAPR